MEAGLNEEISQKLAPPAVIIIGNDVDASAMPLTFERNRFVVDLIRHYSCLPFLKGNNVDVMTPNDVFEWYADPLPVVGLEDMTGYHDQAYLQYLCVRETLSDVDEPASAIKRSKAEEIQPPVTRRNSLHQPPSVRMLFDLVPIRSDDDFNLKGDNSPFIGMWRTIQSTVSGTLTAVRLLEKPGRFAAVHWFGGRHHAKREKAGGFCLVNDVVLGVLELKRVLPRSRNHVLIVDIDAHHGDGTQSAFLFDPSIVTLSMHAFGVGVYPGTGSMDEIGGGLGRGYTMNLPLPEGATDALAVPLMSRAISSAFKKCGERLGALVMVCGSDALQGDPIGSLNLSVGGMQCIVRLLLKEAAGRGLKVLLLGAGGYVDVSCARLAGAITRDVLSCAAALRRGSKEDLFVDSPNLASNLGVHVPEDCEYFTRYGPSFLMHGLPPARLEKIREVPRGSPLLPRLKRVAEKKRESQRDLIEGNTDSESDVPEDDEEEEEEGEEEEDEEEEDDEEEEQVEMETDGRNTMP